MGRSLRGDIGLLVTPCHCHSKFVPLSLQPSSTFSCPLSVSVCHKLIVVSRIPQKGSEDYPTLTLGPRAAWTPNDSASGLTLWPLPHRYAMKCLDKKRIKMKQGETLALNERIMLSLVSTGVSGWPGGLAPSSLGLWDFERLLLTPCPVASQDCPFIVCMSYAFHTPDKLSFILDLMNGECVAQPQADQEAGLGPGTGS